MTAEREACSVQRSRHRGVDFSGKKERPRRHLKAVPTGVGMRRRGFVPAASTIFHVQSLSKFRAVRPVPPQPLDASERYTRKHTEEESMTKTMAVLATVGTIGAAAVMAPAPAEAH